MIAAEMKSGRRLVHVGFMRRFDPGYRAMKRSLESAEAFGLRPLFLHCGTATPSRRTTSTSWTW